MLGRGSWVEEGMVRSGRSLLDLRLPGQAAAMPVSQIREHVVGIAYLLCNMMLCNMMLCYMNTLLCVIVL